MEKLYLRWICFILLLVVILVLNFFLYWSYARKQNGFTFYITTKSYSRDSTGNKRQAKLYSKEERDNLLGRGNNTSSHTDDDTSFPECDEFPSGLQGEIDVSFFYEPPSFLQTEDANPMVNNGGHYKPTHCKAKWKVAIVIPYRNREEHLRYFLQYMHPTLQRQELEYRIYVINQFGSGIFNRAKLLNVGYAQSLQDDEFDCFVFHDVDLILENDFSLYSCPEKPRHLAVAIDKFNYQLGYEALFGGATAMTRKQFEKINGFSNLFWGWGGEDDNLYLRVKAVGMDVLRYPMNIARYRSISHMRDKGNNENAQRFHLLTKVKNTLQIDGLNSLSYEPTGLSTENYSIARSVLADRRINPNERNFTLHFSIPISFPTYSLRDVKIINFEFSSSVVRNNIQ